MKRSCLLLIALLPLATSFAGELWQKNQRLDGSLPASSLAINSKGHIFVGGFDGFLYRSRNKGANWQRLMTGLVTIDGFRAVAINSEDHVFAITAAGVLLGSTDNGNSWNRIQNALSQTDAGVSSFVVDAKGQLFLGSSGKLLRANHRENIWSDIGPEMKVNSWVSSIIIALDERIFIGTSDGRTMWSADQGTSWVQTDLTSFAISSLASNSHGYLFAAATGDGVFRSTDQGQTWIQTNNGLTNLHVLSLTDHSSRTLFAGTKGGHIFRSFDNGTSWTQVATLSNAYGVWSLGINPDGDIFAATDAGVYYSSNNGQTWTQTALTGVQVRSLLENSNGVIFAGTFGGGVYRSTDNGDSWVQTNSGLLPVNVTSLATGPSNHIWAGTLFGGVYRSTNNGDSWTHTDFDTNTVSAVAVNSNGFIFLGFTDFFGTGQNGVEYSSNNAVSWTPAGQAAGGSTHSFAFDDSGYVWIGGPFGAYRTTHIDLDDPDNFWVPYWWRTVPDPDSSIGPYFFPEQQFAPQDVWDIALNAGQDVFAASFGSGVHQLIDTTWAQVNNGITDTLALSLTIATGNQVFAGTFDGSIFRSVDNGASWTLDNAGMTSQAVTSLMATSSGHLFAGTNGDGVFRKLADPAAWMMSISVQAAGVDSFDLAIGGDIAGTDSFDVGLDIAAAPPAFSYYAYLSIPQLPNFLQKDVRGWVDPFDDAIDWLLPVINATGVTTEVVWDSTALPPEGYFFLEEASKGIDVNMRTQDSVQFSGNANLIIRYIPQKCVTFDFDVIGGAWYNVSLPVTPNNNSLATLFPSAVAAFSWDFSQQSYVTATQLDPGRAYWLLFLDVASHDVCGLPFTTYTNNYTSQGWDMIGAVCDTSMVIDNPDSSVISMFGWDPNQQSYVQVVDPFTVDPMQGYWALIFGVPSSITIGGGAQSGSAITVSSEALAAFLAQYGESPPELPDFNPTGIKTEEIPQTFSLEQNYPNPFNPETNIRFNVPALQKSVVTVRLAIYNVRGQLVRVLLDEPQSAGFYEVHWDGKNDSGIQVPSGMYLYRLLAGDFIDTKKLLLLK